MSVDHEMQRVGRITAADQTLDVHVRGVRAYAVPGAVTVPNISTYEWLGRRAKRMLHGLLDLLGRRVGYFPGDVFPTLDRNPRDHLPFAVLGDVENIAADVSPVDAGIDSHQQQGCLGGVGLVVGVMRDESELVTLQLTPPVAVVAGLRYRRSIRFGDPDRTLVGIKRDAEKPRRAGKLGLDE